LAGQRELDSDEFEEEMTGEAPSPSQVVKPEWRITDATPNASKASEESKPRERAGWSKPQGEIVAK